MDDNRFVSLAPLTVIRTESKKDWQGRKGTSDYGGNTISIYIS